MEWYYVQNGASQGPVSWDALERMARNGQLRPNDLVWNSSMGDQWAAAKSVAGLFEQDDRGARISGPTWRARDLAEPGNIKLVDPAKAAWHRMVAILFRPFDIRKWFLLGFSAWLATLGEGGGSFNTGTGGWGEREQKHVSVDAMLTDMQQAWAPVRDFFHQYGSIVIAIVVLVALAGVAIGIALLWVRCRGRFMFLDNVLKDRADISEPWSVWKQHANSLFRWSLVYGFICLLIVLGLLGLSWPLVLEPCVAARAFVPHVAGGIALLVVLFLTFGVVTFYISRFLNDFIIPIMYRHDLTATEAWGRFLALYHANIGRFLAYGLFVVVLQMCAGILIFAAILITCCIAGCLMGLPYIGAVVLLPVTVFFRLYGVEYLAQYGGDFVVEGMEAEDEQDA